MYFGKWPVNELHSTPIKAVSLLGRT